jgi:hypothetical protein
MITFDPYTAIYLCALAIGTGDEGALQIVEPVLDTLVAAGGDREQKLASLVGNLHALGKGLSALGVGNKPAVAIKEVVGNEVRIVGVAFDLEKGLVREGVDERDKGPGSPA